MKKKKKKTSRAELAKQSVRRACVHTQDAMFDVVERETMASNEIGDVCKEFGAFGHVEGSTELDRSVDHQDVVDVDEKRHQLRRIFCEIIKIDSLHLDRKSLLKQTDQ